MIGPPFHHSNFHHSSVSCLARFLLLQLLEFLFCPIDLGLLCGHLLLYFLFLFLSLLDLVADEGAANQADRSADSGTRSGMPCGAANNGTEAGAGNSSDSGTLLRRRQRLRATQRKRQ